MGASFAKTIWEEQHLVTLRSTEGNDVNLLDVLVKGHRGRELLRIGSITNLGSHFLDAPSNLDDQDDGRLDLTTLEKDLEKFTSQGTGSRASDPPSWLKRERLPDWNVRSESLTSLLGNLLDWAKATFNFETGGLCKIQDIISETADLDTLRKFFTADDPVLWTPDIPKIQRLCNLSRSGNLELWVVSKKIYVGSIISGRKRLDGVGVTVPIPLTGLMLAAPVGLEAEHRSLNYVEVVAPPEAPHGMPVGFQAIRLKYNVQDGRLVSHRPDMGKKRLTKRDRAEETFDDPENDPEYMLDLLIVHEEEPESRLDAPRVLNQHPSSEGPPNSQIAVVGN